MPDRSNVPDERRLLLGSRSLERRKKFVGLEPADATRLTVLRDWMAHNADKFTAAFFGHLEGMQEAANLFSNAQTLETAKRLKHDHIIAIAQGEYDEDYFYQRVRLARLYSGAGLEVCVFLGAFNQMMLAIARELMEHADLPPPEAIECSLSLRKVSFFDIGIIVDVLVDERERVVVLSRMRCGSCPLRFSGYGAPARPPDHRHDRHVAREAIDRQSLAVHTRPSSQGRCHGYYGRCGSRFQSRESPDPDRDSSAVDGRNGHPHRSVGRSGPIAGCHRRRSEQDKHDRRSSGRVAGSRAPARLQGGIARQADTAA